MLYNKFNSIFLSILLLMFSCGDDKSSKSTNSSSDVGQTTESSIKNNNPKEKESGLKKELLWTAYKTPNKIPVNGSFKNLSLTNTKEDKPLEESLEGAKFYIDGTTVTSGDSSRDGTLTLFFFKRLASSEIYGSFGKFENNKVMITITLNGKTISKEFSYKLEKNIITIQGSIDLLKDFDSQRAFTSLHRACFDLHEGKTWTEVDLTAIISK
ncbi:hypothetical protein Ga0061079_10788 [Apibacter mensalis]|uniref:YceI-like domain-containing protein n=2 Tax=Apibacter mensalis TaxID=1586267 RepID=A0A0X3AQ37_9FLAO|nr:hypothetical protein Ga0061079_10788 [Apibacter mensalis]